MDREELVKTLKLFKRKAARHHKLQRMLLFGSRATGMARPDSDIDLIVVSDEFTGKSAYDRPTRLYMDWDLDYPVDMLCYTPEEFRRLAKRHSIIREALKTGVTI